MTTPHYLVRWVNKARIHFERIKEENQAEHVKLPEILDIQIGSFKNHAESYMTNPMIRPAPLSDQCESTLGGKEQGAGGHVVDTGLSFILFQWEMGSSGGHAL